MPSATEIWLDPDWEFVSDRVMGGLSAGRLERLEEDGMRVARLTGRVSLENDGGFVQIAFDVARAAPSVSPASWSGIAVTLRGNEAPFEMRLRTAALVRPWQSFRSALAVAESWTTLRLPFATFRPHRTEAAFEPRDLRRIGVLAIGRACDVDIRVGRIGFYR